MECTFDPLFALIQKMCPVHSFQLVLTFRLCQASILGNPEIMVALYTAGANADAPDLTGATALHCAVRDVRLETVRQGRSLHV